MEDNDEVENQHKSDVLATRCTRQSQLDQMRHVLREEGEQSGGRDQARDGNGGDALDQCACHISIPRDPCFLI